MQTKFCHQLWKRKGKQEDLWKYMHASVLLLKLLFSETANNSNKDQWPKKYILHGLWQYLVQGTCKACWNYGPNIWLPWMEKGEGCCKGTSMVVLCSFILVQHPAYSGLNFTPLLGNDAREHLMNQEPESLCQVSQQCKLPLCCALDVCLLSHSVVNPFIICEMMK